MATPLGVATHRLGTAAVRDYYGTDMVHTFMFIYFSIVDLNPSDEDCIYSTLVFVINQNIRT